MVLQDPKSTPAVVKHFITFHSFTKLQAILQLGLTFCLLFQAWQIKPAETQTHESPSQKKSSQMEDILQKGSLATGQQNQNHVQFHPPAHTNLLVSAVPQRNCSN